MSLIKTLFMEQRNNGIDDYFGDFDYNWDWEEENKFPQHVLDSIKYFKKATKEELIKQYNINEREIKNKQEWM